MDSADHDEELVLDDENEESSRIPRTDDLMTVVDINQEVTHDLDNDIQ